MGRVRVRLTGGPWSGGTLYLDGSLSKTAVFYVKYWQPGYYDHNGFWHASK